jgi:hypothetical protein
MLMPKIDFCFRGRVRGVEVAECYDDEGVNVDVSKMDAGELARDLENGKLFISLADHLNLADEEIEIVDFSAHLP